MLRSGLMLGLVSGLMLRLGSGLMLGLVSGLMFGLGSWLALGLGLRLMLGLVFWLWLEFTYGKGEIPMVFFPRVVIVVSGNCPGGRSLLFAARGWGVG